MYFLNVDDVVYFLNVDDVVYFLNVDDVVYFLNVDDVVYFLNVDDVTLVHFLLMSFCAQDNCYLELFSLCRYFLAI